LTDPSPSVLTMTQTRKISTLTKDFGMAEILPRYQKKPVNGQSSSEDK